MRRLPLSRSHLAGVVRVIIAGFCFAPVSRADVRIPIEAKVNGTPVHLALDTGAGIDLMLFTSAAEELGLSFTPPPTNKPKDGEVSVGYTEPATFEWNGSTFPETKFAVVDSPVPIDISGVIGWPVFSTRSVLLKLTDHVVNVAEQIPEEAKSWQQFKLIPNSTTLRFPLGIVSEGRPVEVLIDTGDEDGVTLPPALWRQWREAHPKLLSTMSAKFTPARGLVIAEVVPIKEISLGSLTLHYIPVEGPEHATVKASDAVPTITLGLAALTRLDVAVDGALGIIYLKPRLEPLTQVFPYNRLGAVFVPNAESEDDLVAHVAAHTPAAKAGVRNGDILLKVDQLDVTPWRTNPSILPFSKYWDQPAGTKLLLTLKRKGKTVTAKAVLADLLLPEPSKR